MSSDNGNGNANNNDNNNDDECFILCRFFGVDYLVDFFAGYAIN
jgi:hypothetical protein